MQRTLKSAYFYTHESLLGLLDVHKMQVKEHFFVLKLPQNVNFKHSITIKELKIKLKSLKPLRFYMYIARENTVTHV